jgi:choice-of-anchor C domain-containing protein
MKKLISILGGLVLTLALVTTVSAANLLTNGGFEAGTVSNYLQVNAFNNTSIQGWAVNMGSVDLIGTYWVSSEGNHSIDLSGANAGSMSQTFPTTSGATYKVSFVMAGNPDGGNVVKNMDVDVGASPILFTFDTSSYNVNNMGWVPNSFNFTANNSTTTLTFTSRDNSWYGPALDNVIVEEILPTLPTNKDQCKKDGWKTFGVFKNQGDCVSFVATGGKNPPALLP